MVDWRTDQSKAVQEVLADLKIWKIFVFSSGTIFKKPFCPTSLTLTSHWLMKVASRLKLVFTTRRHIGANYLVGVLNLVSFPTRYFNIQRTEDYIILGVTHSCEICGMISRCRDCLPKCMREHAEVIVISLVQFLINCHFLQALFIDWVD